jgi:hypothetical protein
MGAVVAQERPLQLDTQPLGPEGVTQTAQRRLVMHAMQCAATETDEALAVSTHRVERHRGRRRRRAGPPVARLRMCGGDDPAQVRPAAGVGHEQREVATVLQVELGPVDRPEAQPTGGARELHRSRNRVVVGERHRGVAEGERGRDKLAGQRGAVEE